MAVVITHPEHGVFVGTALGLAFFTNLDCAGQERVCAFKDAADAQDFVNEVLVNGYPEGDLTFVEVSTEKDYATAEDLRAAGLDEAAKALMMARLENTPVEGLGM